MEYCLNDRRFNSGMLQRYIAERIPMIRPAGDVMWHLAAQVTWKDENRIFPRGTINGQSYGKIAEAIQVSESTVKAHLKHLKELGVIGAEVITVGGQTKGVRYYLKGFISWLKELLFGLKSETSQANSDEVAGKDVAGTQIERIGGQKFDRGGAENLPPIQRESSKGIIDGSILNLESDVSAFGSKVFDVIKEESPKDCYGRLFDPAYVWARFKAYNLKQGKSRLPLKALRRYAQIFRDGNLSKGTCQETPVKNAPSIVPPKSDISTAYGCFENKVFARSKGEYESWIRPLKTRKNGEVTELIAGSTFKAEWINREYGKMLADASKPGDLLRVVPV